MLLVSLSLMVSALAAGLAELIEVVSNPEAESWSREMLADAPQTLIIALLIAVMAASHGRRTRRMRERLAREQGRLQQLIDAMPHGVVEIDGEGRLLRVNPALGDTLARLESELLGRPLWSFAANPADGAALRAAVAAAAAGQVSGSVTVDVLRPDNQPRRLRLDWARGGPGEGLLVGVATDVTEFQQASRRLQDIEQRYRALFEHNPDPIYLMDAAGRYADRNAAALAMTGYSRQETLGKPMDWLICEEDRPRVRQAFADALRGEPQRLSLRGRGKDGRLRHIDTTAVPLTVDGEVVGVFGISKDMTARVEAQRRVEESEQRYRALFEPNPDAVYTFDREGRFTSANAATARLTGYPVEDLLARPFAHLIAPEDLARAWESFRCALQGVPRQLTLRLRRRGGGELHVEVSVAPFVVDGRVVGVAGISRDVTSRIVAEARLRDSERQYRSLFERSLVGILLVTPAGGIVAANPAACRAVGRSDEDLRLLGAEAFVEPRAPEVRRMAAQLAADGCYLGQMEFRRADGARFPVEVEAAAFEGGHGERRAVVMFRDITERRAAEASLAASGEELRRLSRFLQTVQESERSRIARELHDELGQCLSALTMDVAWLRRNLPKSALLRVLDQLGRMESTIVATVESVRRLAANLRPTLLDELGLAAACEWLVDDFRRRSGLDCDLRMQPAELEVGDEIATTCYRVLQEALTNVVRHARAERVDVLLRLEAGWLRMTVGDDGVGFPGAAPAPGRFGLVGMRERAHALGGRFQIDSQPGEGTRLRLELPLDAAAMLEAQ